MPYGDIILRDPGEPGHYLWKYLSLHKLIYFLSQESLFFTRLDVFSDPLEGVKTATLRKAFSRNDEPGGKDPGLSLLKTSKATDYIQRKQFINSWFYGERESMAMWNIYSNPESVAIRMNLAEMYEPLMLSFRKAIRLHGRRISLIGDRIRYYKLNPFDPGQRIRMRYSGLKKDISFEHEKEYRFLIYASPTYARRKDLTFAVKLLDFAELPFQVITHPLMEPWKRQNIGELIEKYRLKFEVKESAIYLKH